MRSKGEGSVYQRGDGKWVAQVEAGYHHDTGRRRYLRRVRDTRRLAVDALGELQREVERQLPAEVRDQTVGAWLEWWTGTLEGKVRPKTARNHRDNVRLHLGPHLGRRRLDQLGPQHVERMMAALLDDGLKPKTVREIRSTLRVALKLAVRWGLLDRNAAADARPPKVERPVKRPFDLEEARRFRDAIAGDRLRALYLVCGALGLRQGEALGLTWPDVDLEDGRLRVWRQLKRRDGEYVLEPYAKTSRSRRTLRLPQVCVDAFRERRREQLQERIAAPAWEDQYDDWQLVFTTASDRSQGRPVNGSWVTHHMQAVCRSAGLPAIPFHDLRHTAATLLLAQGVELKVISEILGHSTIKLTADTYSHVVDRLNRDAADRIDEAWGG